MQTIGDPMISGHPDVGQCGCRVRFRISCRTFDTHERASSCSRCATRRTDSRRVAPAQDGRVISMGGWGFLEGSWGIFREWMRDPDGHPRLMHAPP